MIFLKFDDFSFGARLGYLNRFIVLITLAPVDL